MRDSILRVLVLVALACAPVFAEVTSNVTVPVKMTVPVACANGGAGELVQLSGELHILTTLTVNNATTHISQQAQPQHISGVGLITGDKYQGTGVTRSDVNMNGSFPLTTTFINNFRIVGQGPDNNFLAHATVHTTVNANGDVTAQVSNISTECK